MNGWELLADEHGVIAHGDLLDAGLGPRAIALLRRQGLLTALDRGWYAVGSPRRLRNAMSWPRTHRFEHTRAGRWRGITAAC